MIPILCILSNSKQIAPLLDLSILWNSLNTLSCDNDFSTGTIGICFVESLRLSEEDFVELSGELSKTSRNIPDHSKFSDESSEGIGVFVETSCRCLLYRSDFSFLWRSEIRICGSDSCWSSSETWISEELSVVTSEIMIFGTGDFGLTDLGLLAASIWECVSLNTNGLPYVSSCFCTEYLSSEHVPFDRFLLNCAFTWSSKDNIWLELFSLSLCSCNKICLGLVSHPSDSTEECNKLCLWCIPLLLSCMFLNAICLVLPLCFLILHGLQVIRFLSLLWCLFFVFLHAFLDILLHGLQLTKDASVSSLPLVLSDSPDSIDAVMNEQDDSVGVKLIAGRRWCLFAPLVVQKLRLAQLFVKEVPIGGIFQFDNPRKPCILLCVVWCLVSSIFSGSSLQPEKSWKVVGELSGGRCLTRREGWGDGGSSSSYRLFSPALGSIGWGTPVLCCGLGVFILHT